MTRDPRFWRKFVLIGVVLLLSFFALKWVSDRRERERQLEAIATAEGIATVVREALSERTKLVVQELNGQMDVRSVNQGAIFRTSQRSTLPYSATYSVDLSKIRLSDVRYDEQEKRLTIEIPPIEVSQPNVDETRKIIKERTGLWTSREAGEKLAIRSSKLVLNAAIESANRPEKVEKAQIAAREKVGQLFELPLRASGLEDVQVIVRFATDGLENSERWDVGPSIQEVLAEKAQSR